MVLSRFGCHRSPFGSFPRVGKNASLARATGKSPSRHQAQPKAHHLARNEGGPPVPPGRQQTTGITPKAVPSRPREEAISLAQREVPLTSQATRGSGAAMVLARFGCPRSPFGSFPRVGKNASHIRGCAKEPCPPQERKSSPARTSGKGQAFRRKASHCPRHGQKPPLAAPHRGTQGGTESPLPPCIFRAIVL